MTLDEAFDEIVFRGDSVLPPDGKHDLRILVAETVRRLPKTVQDWLLKKTQHVFIGGHGQLGEHFELFFHPEQNVEFKNGLMMIRVIFLSEQLMSLPKETVTWSIAREIAHSRLNHGSGGFDADVEADKLVKKWGFVEPRGRAEERKFRGQPVKKKSRPQKRK